MPVRFSIKNVRVSRPCHHQNATMLCAYELNTLLASSWPPQGRTRIRNLWNSGIASVLLCVARSRTLQHLRVCVCVELILRCISFQTPNLAHHFNFPFTDSFFHSQSQRIRSKHTPNATFPSAEKYLDELFSFLLTSIPI